jgi:hypothetical protein
MILMEEYVWTCWTVLYSAEKETWLNELFCDEVMGMCSKTIFPLWELSDSSFYSNTVVTPLLMILGGGRGADCPICNTLILQYDSDTSLQSVWLWLFVNGLVECLIMWEEVHTYIQDLSSLNLCWIISCTDRGFAWFVFSLSNKSSPFKSVHQLLYKFLPMHHS